MASHIKPEQLLFVGKFLALRPRNKLMAPSRDRRGRQVAEEGNLPRRPITMSGRRGSERLLDAREQLRTVASEEIKRARFYEALDNLSVRDPRIDTAAKVF